MQLKRTNTAILLVTHDITLAESICVTIAVMCDGKIIDKGETFKVSAFSRKIPIQSRLIAAGTVIESYVHAMTKFLKQKQLVHLYRLFFMER